MNAAKRELRGIIKTALQSSTSSKKTTSKSMSTPTAKPQDTSKPIDTAPVMPGPPPAPPRPDMQDLPTAPTPIPAAGPLQRVVTAAVRPSTVEKARKRPDILKTIMREGVEEVPAGEKRAPKFDKEKSKYTEQGKKRKKESPEKKAADEESPEEAVSEGREPLLRGNLGRGAAGFGGGVIGGMGLNTAGALTAMSAPGELIERAEAEDIIRKMVGDNSIRYSEQRFGMPNAYADHIGNRIIADPSMRTAPIIAHEAGHIRMSRSPIGPLLDRFYPSVAEATFKTNPLMVFGAAPAVAAATEDPTVLPLAAQAAFLSPMLAHEGGASAFATREMIRRYGLGGGLRRSAHLVPAFAAYASPLAATTGITAARYMKQPKLDEAGVPLSEG